jgi:hypothetical protein
MLLSPKAPLKLARCPHSLAASLAALPSMSEFPFPRFLDCLKSKGASPHFLHFFALSFFELSAETIALPVIPNTYPRAYKAARSNRESVAAL